MMVVEHPRPGTLTELEAVLAMPDGLPHERVPVDDYFGDYLHGLTAMAAHQGAAATTHGSDAPCVSDSCTPPSSATALMVPASAVGNATPMLHAQQQQQQQLPMQQQPVAMAWQLPMMGNGGSVLAPMMGGGMGLVPMAQMPQGMMLVGKATAHAGEHKNGGSLNGRNGGSSQRQATNREAQKRYRERQKTRLLEMQVTIDRLQRELGQRQGVQSANQQLEEQHYQLQAQLARVETEAETLAWQAQQAQREQQQLRRDTAALPTDGATPMDAEGSEGQQPSAVGQPQQQPAAAGEPQPQASLDSSAAGSTVGVGQRHNSTASLPAAAAAATADNDATANGTTAGCSGSSELPNSVAAAALAAAVVPPEQGGPAGAPGMYGAAPPHESFDDLLSRFQEQVIKVKTFLEEQQLRQHDPASLVLSPSTRGQLLMLIQQSLGICRDLLRVEGVDVIEALQNQDEVALGQNGAAAGSAVRHKWLHVLHVLRLLPQQKEQLLLQRSAHLALMRRIYQQRQQLNMQAMSLMLLSQHHSAAPGSGDSSGGAGRGSPQAAKMATVLRLIKENLRREQRAAMEINSCTLSRILTPVQAGLYICEAFPLHCDALGMCNVLSTIGTAPKTDSAAGSAGTPGHSGATPVSSY